MSKDVDPLPAPDPPIHVRRVRPDDRAEWLRMRRALWPHHDPAELEAELESILADADHQPVFVAARPQGGLCALLEVSVRDHATGCRTRNVGYLEGWFVDPDVRRTGIGRRLVEAAEAWARARGCQEMGSDTDERYPLSRSAHEALGYRMVRQSVHFRKPLDRPVTTMEIRAIGPDRLDAYARIPIAFEVRAIYRVEEHGGGEWGFRLVEEPVPDPYVKDYDAAGDPDGRVVNWARCFDISRWGLFVACEGAESVGAAAVALQTPKLHILEDRDDLGVLWDLRVRPERRRHGIGTALFRHAAEWARDRGCRQLKIETQNTNVPACRFYARQGCVLGGLNRFGYAGSPEAAHETMLLWYLDLTAGWGQTR